MIIQAELRRKQSEYEGEPCAVAAWILKIRSGLHGKQLRDKKEFGRLRCLGPPFLVRQQGQRLM